MVIPVVRQEDAGSTQGITDNCPEWGIYVEGLRGILLPPNQVLVKRMAFYVSGKFSLHKFWKQGSLKGTSNDG